MNKDEQIYRIMNKYYETAGRRDKDLRDTLWPNVGLYDVYKEEPHEPHYDELNFDD